MQTIHIMVQDNYSAKVLSLLESLRGVMLEDIEVEKSPSQTTPTDLIEAQQNIMRSTWDNDEDKAWDSGDLVVCQFCGNKNIADTTTEYTYKNDGKYLIIDNVSCKQCEYCGEHFAKVLKQIEKEYQDIYASGKKVRKEVTVPVESFQNFASV